jgi:hypothetical protein
MATCSHGGTRRHGRRVPIPVTATTTKRAVVARGYRIW